MKASERVSNRVPFTVLRRGPQKKGASGFLVGETRTRNRTVMPSTEPRFEWRRGKKLGTLLSTRGAVGRPRPTVGRVERTTALYNLARLGLQAASQSTWSRDSTGQSRARRSRLSDGSSNCPRSASRVVRNPHKHWEFLSSRRSAPSRIAGGRTKRDRRIRAGEVTLARDRDSTAQILRPRSEWSRGEACETTLRRLRMTAEWSRKSA